MRKKSQPKAKQYSLYCWGKLACEHGKRGKKRFRKRIVFLLFFDQKAFAEPDLSWSWNLVGLTPFGPMLGLLGTCWGHVEPMWSMLWPKLGLFWAYLGYISVLRPFLTRWNHTLLKQHLRYGRICKMVCANSWAQCLLRTSLLIAQGGEFTCFHRFHSGWRQRCDACAMPTEHKRKTTKIYQHISVVAEIMGSWEWYEQTSVTALPVLKGFAKIWVFQFQVSISFRIFFSFILLYCLAQNHGCFSWGNDFFTNWNMWSLQAGNDLLLALCQK